MYYMGEIIALAVFSVIFCGGWVGLYLIIRQFHRKWHWEDQVHENTIRKELMNELAIQYEVDDKGFAQPVIRPKTKQ